MFAPVVFLIVAFVTPAQSQVSETQLTQAEDPSETTATPDKSSQSDTLLNKLAKLSLEQLMNIRISQHEPLGIYHTHSKGEWMIHASAMFMRMDDNRDGTDSMRDGEVLDEFPVAPTRMASEMYMSGVMHAPIEKLTIMVMVPYIRKSMDHITRTGMTFTTRSEGFGDTKVTVLYTAWQRPRHKLHIDFGISIPTGLINAKDITPAGHTRLPYPMQLGSGTWDLQPGLTYQGYSDEWSWGANITTTMRLGRNENEYRLGDRLHTSTWASYKVADWMSVHLRLDGKLWEDIHGADPQLNPVLIPTARPDLRGGERIDFGIGVNLFGGDAWQFRGHRLSCEFAVPIYQSLNGPQLETDWIVKVGWNWQF